MTKEGLYHQAECLYQQADKRVTCEGLKSIQHETWVHIGVRGICDLSSGHMWEIRDKGTLI